MPTPIDRPPFRATLRWLALLTGAVLLVAAKPPRPVDNHHPVANRNSLVTVTPRGTHLLGDPAAKVRLTEYISYTCPHCAHFNAESEASLRLTFVAPGKGSVEVVPYIRNPVDMAAALLVDCGGPAHFLRLHDDFLHSQTQWLAKIAVANDAQRARWESGAMGGRMRAIAGDLGFYQIMENNGFGRAQADHCLNDEAAMKRLAQQTEAAEKSGVEATPSFAIDGVVLAGTNDWAMLAPQLQARQ
jgi:protein-disulfide isomerase